MEKVREPLFAGSWYPGNKSLLLRTLQKFVPADEPKEEATAIVVPHAGYVYSGATAGAVYGRVVVPETVILLGLNHHGYGELYAVADYDRWLTPLGEVPQDRDFVQALVEKSGYLETDEVAHRSEHSLELQLPFLQFLRHEFSIVPILFGGHADDPALFEIGEVIAATIKESEKEVLIVASTDMTHYEDQKTAEEKDHYVLEAIEQLNETELIGRIAERNVSMCGYAGTIVTLIAAKLLGATRGTLVKYATSGDVSKDYEQVVGYAGVIIK